MIGSQNILKRLKSLGQKSRFNKNHARIIASGNPQENIEALLQEVNETILARELEFHTDTGAKLCLNIIGRRVLHITALQMPNEGEIASPLVGVLLSESDHLDQFLQTVSQITKDASELSVIASTPKIEFDTSAVGLQAARLLKNIPVSGPAEETAVQQGSAAFRLLTGIPDIAGWLISEGEDAGMSSGETETVAKLQRMAESSTGKYESYLKQLASGPDKPVATVVGSLSEDNLSILCFQIGGQFGFALVSAETVPLIINKWHNSNN